MWHITYIGRPVDLPVIITIDSYRFFCISHWPHEPSGCAILSLSYLSDDNPSEVPYKWQIIASFSYLEKLIWSNYFASRLAIQNTMSRRSSSNNGQRWNMSKLYSNKHWWNRKQYVNGNMLNASNKVARDSLQYEGPLVEADEEGPDCGTDEGDEFPSRYSILRFSAYFTRLAWPKSLLLRTDVSY